MGENAGNVRVTSGGALYFADELTVNIPDPLTTPSGAWVDYGFIGDNGLTRGHAVNTNEINDGLHGITVRKVKSSETRTVDVDFLEENPAVRELYFGAPVTDEGAYWQQELPAFSPQRKAMIFDRVDGDIIKRLYHPSIEVSDRKDLVEKVGDASLYGVSLTVYPDTATLFGVETWTGLTAAEWAAIAS